MSTEFKNSSVVADTTFTDIYTAPGSVDSSIIFGMSISNINSSNTSITVNVRVEDLSESKFVNILSIDTPIDPGSTLILAGGEQKIVLETGDKIQVSCSDTNSADVFISVLEISS